MTQSKHSDGSGIESGSDHASNGTLHMLRSEMETMFSKIDTIDTSLPVVEPEWVEEFVKDDEKTKWTTLRSIFRRKSRFNMNSGVSLDTSMIVSRDFALNVNIHAESPRFGDIQEPLSETSEAHLGKLGTDVSRQKYHQVSLVSKTFRLATPKFEDMGRGSFSYFWEQFKRSVL